MYAHTSLFNNIPVAFVQKSGDADILLNKGQVKAVRKVIFEAVKTTMKISPLGNLIGYKVSLEASIIWAIRELRLHQQDNKGALEFNIKLDGRPLFGMYIF